MCFLKDVTETPFLILNGKRVPKNRGIVTERIRKVFICFMNSMVKSGEMKE